MQVGSPLDEAATEWLDPTCVFLPSSTEQVSDAVSIFNGNGCPFAIRGGGHSAIRGAANIDDGILVSMKNIRDVTLSPDGKTVAVGMGNTWAQVYEAIEPHGYMVVGGRFGTVGLGLALAAGFSYIINDRGLAVDNVAGHRVVLGNGTVVSANENEHADLHWALKGASNNLGVVTHLVLETVPAEGVYGGRVTYPQSELRALQKLTYDYQVKTAVEALDIHVLPTYVYDGATNTTYGFSPVVYNKLADAPPASLQPWLDVEHSNSTIRNRTYHDLATELVAGFPDGLVYVEYPYYSPSRASLDADLAGHPRQTHYTFTVYPSEPYLSFVLQKFSEICSSFAHIQGLAGLHTVMPITPRAIKKAGGNNPLGFDRARPGESLTGEFGALCPVRLK